MSVRLLRPLLRGPRGGVVAAHPLAVSAGLDTLCAGGNAIDAAVAAAAALAVVAPDACGLGGDALALVLAPGGQPVAYVGAAALPRRPILPVTPYGAASAGVPGAVAAWCAAHRDFGRLSLEQVLAPAVSLAERGFPVSAGLIAALGRRGERLHASAPGWEVLGAVEGSPLKQEALASTLRTLATQGEAGFYRGAVAGAIADALGARDGRGIGREDLAAYTVAGEPAPSGGYGRARVTVVPPPSQALLAIMALESLHGAPPAGTAQGEHASIEAIKQAFERRDALVGGADIDDLRRAPIASAGARASALSRASAADHTAAVVSADADGLVVSMLVSVFHEFGSGVLVPEAGFVLNNRLSGLVGATALPPPGGRPGHTLSPLLLELDGRRLALATPGADGQVQTLLQITRRLVDTEDGLSEALHAARWRAVSGRLAVESSLDASLLAALAGRGHALELLPDGHPLFGAAALAGLDGRGGVLCASDPRREVWASVR